MSKNFKQKLIEIRDKSLEEQRNHLEEFLASWQGDEEQTDDIVVIGVKF